MLGDLIESFHVPDEFKPALEILEIGSSIRWRVVGKRVVQCRLMCQIIFISLKGKSSRFLPRYVKTLEKNGSGLTRCPTQPKQTAEDIY
jgi:hypothetical protein